MANFANYPGFLAEKDTFSLASDFPNFATGTDGWTSLAADGGATVAVGDARGGIVTLTTAATDNNECMLRSTNELFLPAAGRPMFGRVRMSHVEAFTDDANLFFGFASAAGINLMVDDAGGVRASGSIFGIYKIDGGTVWRCRSRNGTETTDTVSTSTAGGATYQTLGVEIIDLSTLSVDIVYTLNGSRLKNADGYDIVHTLLIASSTEMNVVYGIKNGGATLETLVADYCGGWQAR